MVVEAAASEVLLLLGNFARSILHHLPAAAVVPLPIDSLVASGHLVALIVHLKLHIHTLIAKQSVLEHNHLRTSAVGRAGHDVCPFSVLFSVIL